MPTRLLHIAFQPRRIHSPERPASDAGLVGFVVSTLSLLAHALSHEDQCNSCAKHTVLMGSWYACMEFIGAC